MEWLNKYNILKIQKLFWVTLIIMTIQIVLINYAYSQTAKQLWEESARRYDALSEFDEVLSKGTSKDEVISYLGYPDIKEKNVFLGYEVWHYNDVYVYGEDMGSWGIVFKRDRIVDLSDHLFPPNWLGWKQIMKIVFFPVYILLAIPATSFFVAPLALFCLIGISIFQGWWRFFCIYLLTGFVSTILPWLALMIRK